MARHRWIYDANGNAREVDTGYRTESTAGYYIQADIAPYQSMADGTMVEGRKQHREMLKRNNCVEIGSEKQSNQEPKAPASSRSREQLARLVYEKLRY